MKTLYTVLLSCLFLGFITCSSTQSQETSKTNDSQPRQEKKSSQPSLNGFNSGTVILNKEPKSTCSYYLKDAATNTLLDPINLPKDFQRDNLKVWYTSSALRMRNRCGNIKPISIIDIKKREE